MKRYILIVLMSLVKPAVYGQENIIKWKEEAPLQWNDFAGKVNDTSSFEAESFAEVRYRYEVRDLHHFQFDVSANFIKSTSWIKKEYRSQALLKHEQLHFDIAQLYALKMQEMFESYTYSANFDSEIQRLFEQKKREYHTMQNEYDAETSHSLNNDRQKQWESYIANELRNTKLKQHFAGNYAKNPKEGR